MRLLFILLIGFTSTFGLSQNDTLATAKSLVANDQLEEAYSLIDDCRNPSCSYIKADILYRQGQYSSSKELLNQLLIDSFQLIGTHRLLARIYENELNPPKAIKHYSALIKEQPQNALYYRKLGQLYAQAGYPLEALKNYKKTLALNPKDIGTITSYSELNFSLSQIEEADSIIQRAHQLDSSNVKVQLLRAKIAYKKKSYDAVTKILKPIRGRIDLDDYYNKIFGYSLVKVDSFDRALYTLHKVLLNEPEAESVHYYLGLAYEGLNQMDDSKFHFAQALKMGISKQVPLYHNKLARISEEEKDWPKVIKHYKKSLEYKEDPTNYFLLALATDNYYKDKSIAVKYYSKYLGSEHSNKEWKVYALERKKYLKEIAFLQKN